jgi:hypothetical protein
MTDIVSRMIVATLLSIAVSLGLTACGSEDRSGEEGEVEEANFAANRNLSPGTTLPNGTKVPPTGKPYRITPKRKKPSVKSPSKKNPSKYQPVAYTPGYRKAPNMKYCGKGEKWTYSPRAGRKVCVAKCGNGYTYVSGICAAKCQKGYYHKTLGSKVYCLKCSKGYKFYHESTCTKCPKGHYYNWYQPKKSWQCVKCQKGYKYLHKRYCVQKCPKGYKYMYDEPPYAKGPLKPYTLTWLCLYTG